MQATSSDKENKPVILDSGNRTGFGTGAVRDCGDDKGRRDLLPFDVIADAYYWQMDNVVVPYEKNDYLAIHVLQRLDEFNDTGFIDHLLNAFCTFACNVYGNFEDAMFDLAIHYGDGAKKYAENNWKHGIPLSSYIGSTYGHLSKWKRGDQDEPHNRAVLWNIACAIWTYRHFRYVPNLINLKFSDESFKKEISDGVEKVQDQIQW